MSGRYYICLSSKYCRNISAILLELRWPHCYTCLVGLSYLELRNNFVEELISLGLVFDLLSLGRYFFCISRNFVITRVSTVGILTKRSFISNINLGARCGVWSTPRSGRFTPGKGPGAHFIGGWLSSRASLDGCGKSRLPPVFDLQTV